jgi:hypothetical protein
MLEGAKIIFGLACWGVNQGWRNSEVNSVPSYVQLRAFRLISWSPFRKRWLTSLEELTRTHFMFQCSWRLVWVGNTSGVPLLQDRLTSIMEWSGEQERGAAIKVSKSPRGRQKIVREKICLRTDWSFQSALRAFGPRVYWETVILFFFASFIYGCDEIKAHLHRSSIWVALEPEHIESKGQWWWLVKEAFSQVAVSVVSVSGLSAPWSELQRE